MLGFIGFMSAVNIYFIILSQVKALIRKYKLIIHERKVKQILDKQAQRLLQKAKEDAAREIERRTLEKLFGVHYLSIVSELPELSYEF
jgi:DNA-binding transcriptional regulator YbjK